MYHIHVHNYSRCLWFEVQFSSFRWGFLTLVHDPDEPKTYILALLWQRTPNISQFEQELSSWDPMSRHLLVTTSGLLNDLHCSCTVQRRACSNMNRTFLQHPQKVSTILSHETREKEILNHLPKVIILKNTRSCIQIYCQDVQKWLKAWEGPGITWNDPESSRKLADCSSRLSDQLPRILWNPSNSQLSSDMDATRSTFWSHIRHHPWGRCRVGNLAEVARAAGQSYTPIDEFVPEKHRTLLQIQREVNE